ncbi:MAG: molybdenum cofactor guanylyltransferase [Planctomycetota bacterium]
MTSDTPRFHHYILAGGQSQRFGSDKARYKVDGQAMLQRVAECFAPISCSTTIVAQTAGAYDDLGYPTIADAVSNAGPLAGLLTALLHVKTTAQNQDECTAPTTQTNDWILLSSCDLIHASADMVPHLTELTDGNILAVVFTRSKRYEPFPGLYHVSLLPHVEQAISDNQLSYQRLFRGLDKLIASPELPGAYETLDMDYRPNE